MCLLSVMLAPMTFVVTFVFVAAPIWVQALSPLTVTEGESAEFTCSARSAPNEISPSRPKWLRNSKPFRVGPGGEAYLGLCGEEISSGSHLILGLSISALDMLCMFHQPMALLKV